MKYILLSFLSILCLKAKDTNSVDTSNFDFHLLAPFELSYTNTKDDGALYFISPGIGFALEYNSIEFQTIAMMVAYSYSDTLLKKKWNEKNNNLVAKYGGTLLYRYTNQLQIGIEYNEYAMLTNEGSTLVGSAYGKMSSYSLKLLYDPIEILTDERKNTLLIGLSLGYLDANNIKYVKTDYDIRTKWSTTKKKYDLSGFMTTLSFIYKWH